jgi:hypothetical protein
MAPLSSNIEVSTQTSPLPNLQIIDGLQENAFLCWIVARTMLSLS